MSGLSSKYAVITNLIRKTSSEVQGIFVKPQIESMKLRSI